MIPEPRSAKKSGLSPWAKKLKNRPNNKDVWEKGLQLTIGA